MAAEQKDHQQTIDAAMRNWQAEVETAQTYRDLAEREPDEKRKGILIRMAEAEERHAHRWEEKLRDMGQPIPTVKDSSWRRLNGDLLAISGPISPCAVWRLRQRRTNAK